MSLIQKMIETPRLHVSAMKLDDCEEVRLIHNDPNTLKWLSDTHIVTKEEQLMWFERLQESVSSRRFVAREKSSAKMIGVFRFDRYDPNNHSADVGLDIEVNSRRQGFAREIYLGLIPYFFEDLKLNRLSLLTLENNLPAISLYEGLGFKREGTLRKAFKRDSKFIDAFQYSLLASEFG